MSVSQTAFVREITGVLLDTAIPFAVFHGIRSTFAGASNAELSGILTPCTIVFGMPLVPAGPLADQEGVLAMAAAGGERRAPRAHARRWRRGNGQSLVRGT